MVPAGSAPSQESGGGGSIPVEGGGGESGSEGKAYRSKEQLMLRANSLKKALRQIIEQAEKGTSTFFLWRDRASLLGGGGGGGIKSTDVVVSVVDEQNRHTQVQRMPSSSSIKRENSEELKDGEPRECPSV